MTSPIPSDPRTQRQLYHAPASTAVAVSITAAAIVTTYTLQGTLIHVAPAVVAIGGAYVLVTAGVVGAAKALQFSVGLRPAALRFWIAAVLVGVSAWYVGLQLVEWLHPSGTTDAIERGLKNNELLPALIGFAVLPAIAEELVFRGVLARSVARLSPVIAIVIATVVFSSYHLNPSQILGTLPFSLAASTLAVRSGSVLPGMLAHVLNNAIVIALTREALPSLDKALGAHPGGALVSAIAILLLGLGLAAKGVA
jgi:uncharacterized protein